MKNKRKKKKFSNISIVLITFLWIVAVIFTLVLIINSVKNKIKLEEIKSKIKIPDGFYYVGGDIDTGVVISDNEKDEFKGIKHEKLNKLKGNQFVWVPVETVLINDFTETNTLLAEGKNPIALKLKDNNYVGLNYNFNFYSNTYDIQMETSYYSEPYIIKEEMYGDSEQQLEGSTKDLYQKSFNKMVESVEKYKGFYISRFEAGNLKNAVKNNGKIVSKASEEDITYQDWFSLYKAANNMYERDDITTEIIWGCQWDATLAWISKQSDLYNFVFQSEEVGNYNGILEKTGSESNYSLNNIYDLAGNAFEWTQRGSDIGGRESRGGSYLSEELKSLASYDVYGPTYLWDEVGTRITMYIN